MKTVHFELVCGASGDMILSSLLDLGVSIDWLNGELARLGVHGLKVELDKVQRSGITCAHIAVHAGHQHAHRHLHDLLHIAEHADFSATVLANYRKVLTRIGEAEAKVHNVALDHVHFHEIGAVDTIVDVLGACLCLEHLGVEAVTFSALTNGHGTITTAHGTMPVPAPATAEMMQGFVTKQLDIEGEILTPTGCAVLTALGTQSLVPPDGTVVRIGYGCGDKTFANFPNMLRAHLVDTAVASGSASAVCIIETDMDHISGEVMAYAAERLMQSGALDVSWMPVYMKKGRPAYRLTVVCEEAQRSQLIDVAMAETRTLGVRWHTANRVCAQRTPATVEVLGQQVTAKTCIYQGRTFTKMEFDAAAALARKLGRPLLEILDEFARLA